MSDTTAAGGSPTPTPGSPTKEEENLSETDYSVEDAMEEGAALAMEQVQEHLNEADLEMDPDTGEIYGPESAFDPRPRGRGGRFKKRTRHRKLAARKATRKAGPWHHRLGRYRYLDPAPSRARATYGRYKDPVAKALNKVAPYASTVGAAGTFYLDYKARAEALGLRDAKGNPDIVAAIKADIKNFKAQDVPGRLMDNASSILGLTIAGHVLKMLPIGQATVRRLGGNILLGAATAKIGKAILDPPIAVGAPSGSGGFPMTGAPSHPSPTPGVGAVLPGEPIGRAF